MNETSDSLRHAFQKPVYAIVRVTPAGFQIHDATYPELRGRITRMTLVRKFFHDGVLACSSPDGVRATDGTLCANCLDPRCQPRLRVHLTFDKLTYLLDLAGTSATNLFRLEDEAKAQGLQLLDCPLRLTIASRGHWGEVIFHRSPNARPPWQSAVESQPQST